MTVRGIFVHMLCQTDCIVQYTYIVTIPLILVYAMGFAIIKYNVGYTFVPGHGSACYSRHLCFPLLTPLVFSHPNSMAVVAEVVPTRHVPPSVMPVYWVEF